MKILLYIALVVSIITYLLWGIFPKGTFYLGNALFVVLLCTYLFNRDRQSVVKFILLSLAINNLADELFFDNTKLEMNEIFGAICIIILSLIKYRNDRKRSNDMAGID